MDDKNTANYHDLKIEIHGNHPLANSTNYSLSVDGTEQRGVSQRAELSEVKNPSPRGKGKAHTKKPETY